MSLPESMAINTSMPINTPINTSMPESMPIYEYPLCGFDACVWDGTPEEKVLPTILPALPSLTP